ncbi:uncharacterized protein LOC130149311 isoform X2 [Falco biarmicus]|uniref:uncharacterized protein LOC130149311 isoform X2 n=1 Tax=Falco biarmicus TaxID=345155 RepID=UPI0024BC2EEF|nr:uncharacterized protein LOC130149311 isoform X2 [Falco biarmicus]
MGYAYGPGRWVHFRPARRAGAAVEVRSLRREPGRVSGRDVRRRAGFVWNCTLTNQGERNRRAWEGQRHWKPRLLCAEKLSAF